jgi:3-deoxy-D-manno-octulosonic acid kinase
VIAAAWYRSGRFYRADLVTEWIADARTLADVLFAEPRAGGANECLERAGRLTRALGEAGVRHPDLNARNLLIGNAGAETPAFVIDLDRARVWGGGSPRLGRRMLKRLARSLDRLGAESGQPLSAAEWSALRGGFEERP